MRAGVAIEGSNHLGMRSQVNWALLGLVIQRPSYGYELVQRFQRIYDDALELSSVSQIYTALDTLARRGLIEEIPPEGPLGLPTRQPKPHYRATVEGVQSYRQWLTAHVQDERRRSRLFARQLAMLPAPDALVVLDCYEQACLAEACATPVGAGEGSAEEGGGLVARLEAEDARRVLDARLPWIAYARMQFSAHAPTPSRARALPSR
jgi:DNA-binding PadR family transcriptional regulator